MSTTNYPDIIGGQQWPFQKRSTASKNKEFVKNCLDAAVNMPSEVGHILNAEELYENDQIVKGKLDPSKLKSIVNPLGLTADTYKPPSQSYPLLKDKLDLLIGEEWKRKFDYTLKVVNPGAVNSKVEGKVKVIKNAMAEVILNQDLTDEAKREKIDALDKNLKNYRDIREIRGNRILEKEYANQDLKSLFNKGFENLLKMRGEILAIDIINNKPEVRIVDPRNIKVIRAGKSNKVDDADIVLEESYESPGWIIDRYYKNLKSSEVKSIDSGLTDAGQSSKGSLNYYDTGQPTHGWNDTFDELIPVGEVNARTGGYKDEFGNIRVRRLVWRSLRKLGIIKWIDKNGRKQEKIVDENYKVRKNLGEKVEWVWATEYWRVVQIGKDIFPEWGPRPIQYRRRNDISSAGNGYYGTLLDNSLVDLMKPFQVLYDVIMERTKHAFMTSRGKIAAVDIARKPKKWSDKKWFYYMDVLNTLVEDSFSESDRGVSKGKIAGNMQQRTSAIDLEQGSYIQQHILMLQYIEERIGDIAGIPKAREGQSSPTETATGVRNSISQSYHITEPYFAIHEKVKERVLEGLLETSKYCIKQDPELYRYYLSDEGIVITQQDIDDFVEQDYGLDVTTSGQDTELLDMYKQLVHPAIQNDRMKLSILGKIFGSNSMAEITRYIEDAEDRSERMVREQSTKEREVEMAKLKREQDKQNRELASKERMNTEDSRTDIMEKLIELEKASVDADSKQNVKMQDIIAKFEELQNAYEVKMREIDVKDKDLAEKRKNMNKQQGRMQS